MRNIKGRIQNLSTKAAQFKAALESAPTKAAELRQAIVQTVGEFQQIKDDFQVGTPAFPEVMQQITSGKDVITEAGYCLDRLEMEVGLNPRLTILLDREEEIDLRTLRELQKKHEGNVALRSLLTAMVKAEEMAVKVHLPGMTYYALAVEIGMSPSIQLRWCPTEALAAVEEKPVLATPPPLTKPTEPASSFGSSFGQGSFFERRTSSTTPVPTTPQPLTTPEEPSIPAPAAKPAEPSPAPHGRNAWKRESLERFKKMPDLTK